MNSTALPLNLIFNLLLTICISLYAETNINFRLDNELNGICDISGELSPKLQWRKQLEGNISATPVADNDNIYVNCSDNFCYCLSLSDGSEKWKYAISAEAEAPVTIYKDSIIICTTDNHIIRVSNTAGKEIWKTKTGGKITGAANIFHQEDKELILTGSYDHNIYCLDYNTGKISWQIEADNYINGSISISKTLAAVGSCDGNVYLIDIPSGQLKGKLETGDYIPGWPVLTDTNCYCGNYAGRFFCFDLAETSIKWKYEVQNAAIMGGPAVDSSKVIYANDNGTILCLDKSTGKEIWIFNIDDQAISAPLISEKYVFTCSENGWTYILDINTGKITWKYLIGEEMSFPVYIYNNKLLLADNSGRIYCFNLTK